MAGRAVVLLSGGLDSTTAAALARREGWELYGLTIRYGQVHVREVESARQVARALGFVRHVELDLDLRAFGGSSLLGEGEIPKSLNPPVPQSLNAEIPSTYVPARNTIFLSLALGWAEVLDASTIVLGVNAIDYSGYPDCRPEYLAAFEYLATLATRAGVGGKSIRIWAPLVQLSKAGIIRLGTELGVDYGMTHSCYDPGPSTALGPGPSTALGPGPSTALGPGPSTALGPGPGWRPCGQCDSCRLRAQGFAEAGVPDPLLSRDD
jgi:7-cyano-7-deazaguanine synthase